MSPYNYNLKSYSEDVMPARLNALEVGFLACYCEATPKAAPIKSSEVIESLGKSKVVRHSAISHGALSVRATLEFFSIARRDKGLINRGGRLPLEKCNLKPVRAEEVCSILKGFTKDQTEAAIINVWGLASKGVAHHTVEGSRIPIRDIAIATLAASKLLRIYFFEVLKISIPVDLLLPLEPISSENDWLKTTCFY